MTLRVRGGALQTVTHELHPRRLIQRSAGCQPKLHSTGSKHSGGQTQTSRPTEPARQADAAVSRTPPAMSGPGSATDAVGNTEPSSVTTNVETTHPPQPVRRASAGTRGRSGTSPCACALRQPTHGASICETNPGDLNLRCPILSRPAKVGRRPQGSWTVELEAVRRTEDHPDISC